MSPSLPRELEGLSLLPNDDLSGNLERKLDLFPVVIISLSAMIGSGLFVLPALAMLEMGGGHTPVGGVWLAYLLAAVVVLPAAISKSELATAMPSSGGSYVYVQETFGPLIGTISGLGLWANFMLKSAFALIGFKAYLWVIEDVIGFDINIESAAMVLLLLIVGINILGLKRIKKVQTPIVMTSAAFLLGICVWALFTMEMNWDAAFSRESFGTGLDSVATTAAFVFVSYAGVTKIAAVGGEIRDPGKTIPKGILLSLLFSTILYVFVTMVMAMTVEPEMFMEGSNHHAREDPVYLFAAEVGGADIGLIAAVLSVITMTSMALAGIMAASRFPYAMSVDKLLPEVMGEVHDKFHTPHWAIIATGLSMAAAITFLPVHDVAELASGFKIMIFIVINGCVIVLRGAASSHWYNPEWQSPMYPFFQIFGILGGMALLLLMGSKALIGGGAAIVLGTIIYTTYGQKHVKSEITPWKTYVLMSRDPIEVERRRRMASFHLADTDRSGAIDLGEFIAAAEMLGFSEGDHAELEEQFRSADTDENGLMDIDEYAVIVDKMISGD